MNPISPLGITASTSITQDELEEPGVEARVSTALAAALGKELMLGLKPQILRSKQEERGKIQFSTSCVALTMKDFKELAGAIRTLTLDARTNQATEDFLESQAHPIILSPANSGK